jgi:hypothetical protein
MKIASMDNWPVLQKFYRKLAQDMHACGINSLTIGGFACVWYPRLLAVLHSIPIHFEWNSFALISVCIADPGLDQIGRLSVYLTITPTTPLRPGEVAFKTFCVPPYGDKHPL